MPDRGDRATATWFAVAAPTLWLVGRLLRSAEEEGAREAQRTAGATPTAVGLAGTVLMPVSGLAAVAAAGILAWRRASAGRGLPRRGGRGSRRPRACSGAPRE